MNEGGWVMVGGGGFGESDDLVWRWKDTKRKGIYRWRVLDLSSTVGGLGGFPSL